MISWRGLSECPRRDGEAVGIELGIGAGLSGRLLLWDSLEARFRDIRLRRDPGCALCGENATIHDLSAHATEATTPVCGVA